MEDNSSAVVFSSNTLIKNQNGDPGHCSFIPKKKKRGPMHFFRVALFMIKSKKTKNAKSVSIDAVSIWEKLFGLHVKNGSKDPPRLTEGETAALAPVLTNPVMEHLEVFTPPMSPAQASVASSSSCGMSQYASATNLQDLAGVDEGDEIDDEDDDEDQEIGVNGEKGGDEMIDLKAEQFIAQFYQQMKIQHETYNNRRNRRSNFSQ
ncbi:uncharacterized protein LOC126686247 [Mercurialis annua]|uniref:uncharacterized protein LOC126686247 n=1 Tax=Mercurialis annua TaxID=3986 RepID=UPI00215F03BB|nr:uncharacterized protein LOC126686247 [Mercurialis annua]